MKWFHAAGALTVAGGLFVALALPSLMARNTGVEKARLTVFDRKDGGWEHGWRPIQVDLGVADSPVRIEVEAEFLPVARPSAGTANLVLVVALNGQVVSEGTFELALQRHLASDRNPPVSSLIMPQFRVAAAGRYTITVRSTESTDRNFSRATAVIRTGIVAPDRRYQIPGYVTAAFGAALYVFGGRIGTGRRRRRKARRR